MIKRHFQTKLIYTGSLYSNVLWMNPPFCGQRQSLFPDTSFPQKCYAASWKIIKSKLYIQKA